MAEDNESSQEKTEDPSDKKLREARQNGQAPRSKEVTSFVAMVAFFATAYLFSDEVGRALAEPVAKTMDLSVVSEDLASEEFKLLKEVGISAFWIAFLLTLFMTVVHVAGTLVLGGFFFSMKPVKPNFSKLNPLKGLKRMFSMKSFMEMIKSVLKFILLAGTASLLIKNSFQTYLDAAPQHINDILPFLVEDTLLLLLLISLSFIVVPTIDAPFQVMQFTKQLRMTKQEVKDEHKETDGNPEVKAKVREIQMRMANQRSVAAVPEADVIVVNPSHYSVALKFDPQQNAVPVVIGKGVESTAFQMREIAGRNKLPVVSAPAVARSLYYYVDIDNEIPKQLIYSVAAIYRFIQTLERKQRGKPIRVKDIEKLTVPSEFHREA